jgi:hypothetical protein
MSSVPIFYHLKESVVPGSEKLSVENEWMFIDYHTLFEALDLMRGGGWGCCRIRGTERHSVGFGLPTAAIILYRSKLSVSFGTVLVRQTSSRKNWTYREQLLLTYLPARSF